MTEPLYKLFGTEARVRLLRMFLFNEHMSFSMNEILRRAKLSRQSARTELNQLERAGIIKKKIVIEQGKKRKERVLGYGFDETSSIAGPLRTFLFATAPINGGSLIKHLKGIGKIQALVAAGVFMNEFDRRLDVLIVVDTPRNAKIEKAIRNLEAELGIEIKYTVFLTEDFKYRIGMYDKLTRDVFDYPHQLLVDRVGVADMNRR